MGIYAKRFETIKTTMQGKIDKSIDDYFKAVNAAKAQAVAAPAMIDAAEAERGARASMEAGRLAAVDEARAALRALFAEIRAQVGANLAAPPKPGQAEYLDALRAKTRITQTDLDAAAVALDGWPAAAGVLLDMAAERPGLKVPAGLGSTGAGLLAQLDNAAEVEVMRVGRYRAGTPDDRRYSNLGDALRATVGLTCEAIDAAEAFLGVA